jgi:hypothetical protein
MVDEQELQHEADSTLSVPSTESASVTDFLVSYVECPRCSHVQKDSDNEWCGKNLKCNKCSGFFYYADWGRATQTK